MSIEQIEVLSDEAAIAKFTALKERHAALEKRRAKIEATVEEAARRYAEEAALAREQLGTDNIAEIRGKVSAARQENTSILKQYEEEITSLEAQVVAAEQVIQAK